MINKQTKTKRRITDHGEVFTGEREVNAMLDLVKQETERIDSRFLEPACGDGNFLVEILRRKLTVVKRRYGRNHHDYERYAVIAVSSIYGIDLLPDNVNECKQRLFTIFNNEYTKICKRDANDETRKAIWYILGRNILCGDALTMKDIDYHPLVFSEWSAINSFSIKRRDYSFEELVTGNEDNMFNVNHRIKNDIGETAFIPQTVADFAPIHYRRVQENG